MDIVRDLKQYCGRRSLAIVATYVVFLALFGMWAFHDMVTFDAEGFYSLEGGVKWYVQWIELGRWGFVALKSVLGVIAINPYFSAGMLVVLFPLSSILWAFAIDRWGGGDHPAWMLVLFCSLLMSHPVWAQQFAYRNQMEVMSVALALAPVGMILLGEFLRRGSVVCGVLSVLIATFLFGCYQSFIFMYVEAVCILLLLGVRAGEVKRPWRDLLTCIGFLVVSFVACEVVSKVSAAVVLGPDGGSNGSYLSGQFQWGKRSFADNVVAILVYVKHTAFGDGIHFGPTLAVEGVALLGMLVFWIVRRREHVAFLALMCLGVLASPYLLEVATAGEIVVRSQFALVLALAFLGVFELGALVRSLDGRLGGRSLPMVAAVAVALAAVVFQAQQQSRLFYTDVATMDEDREVMGQLFYQAMAKGARPGDAFCAIGYRPSTLLDTMVKYEAVGYSYFEHSGFYGPEKMIEAMRGYGLDVAYPSKEQMDAAKAESASMAVWPTAGSVSVHDGYYVVRFS